MEKRFLPADAGYTETAHVQYLLQCPTSHEYDWDSWPEHTWLRDAPPGLRWPLARLIEAAQHATDHHSSATPHRLHIAAEAAAELLGTLNNISEELLVTP
jgi:hypothetical protein